MKKTLLKKIKRTLFFLFYSTLSSFILLAFFLLSTTKGLDVTVKLVEKYTQGAIKLTGVKGTLIHSLHFKKVVFSNSEQTITLENAIFKWNPLALLEWHLQIGNLSSQKVLIVQKPTKTSQKIIKQVAHPLELTLPKLPIYLVVHQFNFDEVQVKSENKTIFHTKALRGDAALTRTQLKARLQTQLISPFQLHSRLKLSGNTKHYKIQLALSGKNFHWKLAGQGDEKHFVFNTLQDNLFKGKLSLSGWVKSPEFEINTQPNSILSPQALSKKPKKEENLLHWAFSLTASNLEFNQLFPLFINGTLTGEGRDTEGKLTLKLVKSRYHQLIDGQAALHFNYPFIQNFNADIYSGKNALSIKGTLFQKWAINWKAYIENLKIFHPDLEGQLTSQGSVSGSREKPEVKAHLSIKGLKTEQASIKDLNASASFKMGSLNDSQIVVDAQRINVGNYHLSNITLNGNLKEKDKNLRVDLQLKPGKFEYPFENKILTEYFSGGLWKIDILPRRILTYFDIHLMGKSHFQGQLSLPKQIRNTSNQMIKGNIKGEVNHLDFISNLANPAVRNFQGQLSTSAQISGTISKPEIKSLFTLKASAFLPILNLHLKNIELSAKGEKQVIIYDGQAKSENTLLKLTGKTHLKPKEVLSEFHLTSKDFLLTNTREIKIHAAPDLKIASKNGKTDITGTIHIPQADIKPLDFTNIITLPEDTKFTHKKPAHSIPVESDILLTLGDNINLKYQGLSGYLTGEVRIKNKPLQPTTGTGEIKIKHGVYEVKGRKLTIHRGALFFTGGPLSNPSIQIQATRKIQVNNIGGIDPNMDFGLNELFVGVNVTGTLRRHQVKLFSEPPGISQSNIFSYLVTGQAGNQGGSYSPLIMEAANTLGGGATSSFSEKIKKGLGLTDITIQNTSTQGDSSKEFKDRPQLILGKALTPALYINYAVTKLASPLSGLQARYQLTKHWVIQTTGIPGDKNASIDLIQHFESKD